MCLLYGIRSPRASPVTEPSLGFVFHIVDSSEQKKDSSPIGLKDQQVLDVAGYAELFSQSVTKLWGQLKEKGENSSLVWDKVSDRRGRQTPFCQNRGLWCLEPYSRGCAETCSQEVLPYSPVSQLLPTQYNPQTRTSHTCDR